MLALPLENSAWILCPSLESLLLESCVTAYSAG